MPVQLFRPVGLVVNVDGHLAAFSEAQQRSRKLAVVCGCRKDAIRSNLDWLNSDRKGVVRRSVNLRTGFLLMRPSRLAKDGNWMEQGTPRHDARCLQELSTREERIWHGVSRSPNEPAALLSRVTDPPDGIR